MVSHPFIPFQHQFSYNSVNSLLPGVHFPQLAIFFPMKIIVIIRCTIRNCFDGLSNISVVEMSCNNTNKKKQEKKEIKGYTMEASNLIVLVLPFDPILSPA